MIKTIAMMTALIAVGCGDSAPITTPVADLYTPNGLGVHIGAGAASWVGTPEFLERLDVLVTQAEVLTGKKVSVGLVTSWHGGDCGRYSLTQVNLGLNHTVESGWSAPWIEMSTDATWVNGETGVERTWVANSIEETAFRHELLHVLNGNGSNEQVTEQLSNW